MKTKGTETSKYLKEKKSTEILLVVASESRNNVQVAAAAAIKKTRMFWKEQPKRVIAPYMALVAKV